MDEILLIAVLRYVFGKAEGNQFILWGSASVFPYNCLQCVVSCIPICHLALYLFILGFVGNFYIKKKHLLKRKMQIFYCKVLQAYITTLFNNALREMKSMLRAAVVGCKPQGNTENSGHFSREEKVCLALYCLFISGKTENRSNQTFLFNFSVGLAADGQL